MRNILSVVSILTSQTLAKSLGSLPIHIETRSKLDSNLANIHIRVIADVEGHITYTYGQCEGGVYNAHHQIAVSSAATEGRLVWLMPNDVESGGCILAWDSNGALVGRSNAQRLQPSKRNAMLRGRGENSIEMSSANGIDASGPWFDGVALLESKNLSAVDVAAAKSKNIAVVGAGMSGLMTYLVLHQSGFDNVSIIEAAQRLGGRVHTEYLSGGPFDYSYQEMGPMRFPSTLNVANETYNITDHQLVFQLADEINTLNGQTKNWSVDFIPWYQSNSNGLVYKNGFKLDTGLPPTVAQLAANPSLLAAPAMNPSTKMASETIEAVTSNETFKIELALNMHQAHKDFIEGVATNGFRGDEWSEFAYLVNYLKANLNDTDVVLGGSFVTSFWDTFYDGMYFEAATWKTIDGGLSRLPSAFHPLVDNVTTMNRAIERIDWLENEQRVQLAWKDKRTNGKYVWKNASYDYAVLAVPFAVMKGWRMPQLPTTISAAITELPMTAACKVALEFNTRFWEHYENPIYGGCSTTSDIPGISSICYPSYDINGTGPATMLASYISDNDWGQYWVSTPESEHVQYVLDSIIEIHGGVAAREYTGNYNRRCWAQDPYTRGSWASPKIGQHELYIPEYFKTHSNLIFVGEHTSYTHAWISSALESGVRGAIQLMLELGLVDEAKAANKKWMARWIHVVSSPRCSFPSICIQ
ncbi:L-amino-acid oxidase [Xylariaceae sp. FL1272]|nr:L-amino-acid oxidase [Xylariaceae sp. FL1272]